MTRPLLTSVFLIAALGLTSCQKQPKVKPKSEDWSILDSMTRAMKTKKADSGKVMQLGGKKKKELGENAAGITASAQQQPQILCLRYDNYFDLYSVLGFIQRPEQK